MKQLRAEVIIRGRVQGVWFRQSTRQMAQQNAVNGWCRNNPDGTVEAVFEGSETAVQAVLDWCRQGPGLARVDHLQVEWQPATGEFSNFQVR